MPKIRMVSRDNLLLLGAPICEEAIEGVLQEKLQDLQRMTDRLTTIDAHDAIFLFRSCYAIPKLTYFLRSALTYRTMASLRKYDPVMKKSLKDIININFGSRSIDSITPSCQTRRLGHQKGNRFGTQYLPIFSIQFIPWGLSFATRGHQNGKLH